MNNKVTIQRVSDDIAGHLREHGVTAEGNKFLTAGHILRQAGVLDHLVMMYEDGQGSDDLLELVDKSVSIGRIIRGDQAGPVVSPDNREPDPEPERDDPSPAFSA